jgi:hypothetical protein
MVCERDATDQTSKGRKSASAGDSQERNSWLSEQEVVQAIEVFAKYLRQGRELYYGTGQALSHQTKFSFTRFFAPVLLDRIRVVELVDRRIANPAFCCKATVAGIVKLPDIAHVASVTFQDVVVFNEPKTERTLFHGLVHAAQIQLLGLERFAELFVRGFVRTKSYSLVPIKAHAFEMDARFAANRAIDFSVEDEVWRRVREYRY